ncbi:MAG: hypothetical protein Q9204_004684 [Flavoplaca sp. TL-2023a]
MLRIKERPLDAANRGSRERVSDVINEDGQVHILEAGDQVRDFLRGGRRGIENNSAKLARGILLAKIVGHALEFARIAAMKNDVEIIAGKFNSEVFANSIACTGYQGPRFVAVVVLREGGGTEVETYEAGKTERKEG